MQKLLVFIFLIYCMNPVNAQFSVNTAVQRHSNVFFQDAEEPFNAYANWGIGGSYQSNGFHVHTSISGTIFKESLHSNWQSIEQGSFGSINGIYNTKKSVDVEIEYVGCRVGMDYVFNHQGKFNLLMGLSVQTDWLVAKRESNYSMTTTYPFYYPSYNGNAVSALDQFVYWNLMFKPRYYFLPFFYAELQFGFSFYYDPRIKNSIISGASDGGGAYSYDKNYYTVNSLGLLSNYAAYEIGLSVGYRFKEK